MIERIKRLLMSPAAEWAAIDREPDTSQAVFLRWAVPLAAIGMSTLLGHLAFLSVQDPGQSMPWAAGCAAVVIGLVSYTLLILIRSIIAGLDGVPPDVREAADGMGFGSWGRLWTVELPLALPVIVAGLRVATVTTIGLVTVTALIGQGGLGQLILTGLLRPGIFETMIYVGAILSLLLAVLADSTLLVVQRSLTPWARARG